MDGNGRWAKAKGLPRSVGHKAGVTALRDTVMHCVKKEIATLTVYAFSRENWQRPSTEVDFLLGLFLTALDEEVDRLDDNNVHLGFIGDTAAFPDKLQQSIAAAENKTKNNDGLHLVVAVNYGGRWEISRICRELAEEVHTGGLQPDAITEMLIDSRIKNRFTRAPDLFIRTGGEQRISNFLLWQLAYSELYFTDLFWPDFNEQALDKALAWYAGRNRRFGRLCKQG